MRAAVEADVEITERRGHRKRRSGTANADGVVIAWREREEGSSPSGVGEKKYRSGVIEKASSMQKIARNRSASPGRAGWGSLLSEQPSRPAMVMKSGRYDQRTLNRHRALYHRRDEIVSLVALLDGISAGSWHAGHHQSACHASTTGRNLRGCRAGNVYDVGVFATLARGQIEEARR